MRLIAVIILALISTALAAEPTQSNRNLTPPPPKQPSMFDRPREPSVWEGLQDSVDRSTGRIVDEPTYQLDRIYRRRDEDLGKIVPQTEFQRYYQDRERQLRIEQQQRAAQIQTERQRREELDRREYELFLRAGLPSSTLQVMADERALNNAKAMRDQQMAAAEKQRAENLAARPEDRNQIESDYQKQVTQIRQQYETERARILGFGPATQPSP